ncbi:MAG: hypothetical protein EOO27_35455 [Comamonadaceae bacterium]|nr:MAG: hypothetical protein EOO27_35455 [Comamonadaceae bacterium]
MALVASMASGNFSSAATIGGLLLPLVWFGIVTPLRRREAHQQGCALAPAPTPVRSGIALVAIGLFFVGVVLSPEPDPDATANESTSSQQPTASLKTEPQAAPNSSNGPTNTEPTASAPALQFSETMVRAQGITKENKGGQSNIRFVAGTDSVEALGDLTEQCIDHFLEKTKAAYCYAYGSDVDYDHKTFDWTPEFDQSEYGGSRPCWIFYGGQPLSGPGDRGKKMTSGMEYLLANCPGTIAYPDEDGTLAAERARKAQAAAAASRPRNPCALVDTDALGRHGFKTVVGDVTGGTRPRFSPTAPQRPTVARTPTSN